MASDLKQLVRTRMTFTGEPWLSALNEIRQFGPLPPAANLWQEWFEFFITDCFGDATAELASIASVAAGPTVPWPADTVMGIRSVTPRPDRLILDIEPTTLGAILEPLLPTRQRSIPRLVLGVPGLRAQHVGNELVLSWPGCGAVVVIGDISERRWRQARDQVLAHTDNRPELGEPLWVTYPNIWTRAERDHIWSGANSRPGFPHHTWIASGVLRRVGLFYDAMATVLAPIYPGGPLHPDKALITAPETLVVDTRRFGPEHQVHVPLVIGETDVAAAVSKWPIRRGRHPRKGFIDNSFWGPVPPLDLADVLCDRFAPAP